MSSEYHLKCNQIQKNIKQGQTSFMTTQGNEYRRKDNKSDNCNTSLLHNGYSSHSYTLPVNSNFRIPQKKK